jgi:coenzyme F420-dependent glucose-6-phosphate dehydrogenase
MSAPRSVELGYKASAEQFGPRELLELSALAAGAGLGTVAVSDHLQPWRHHGGHSPAVLPFLGALAERAPGARIGTSVLTPTMRYHPVTIAQAFATLGLLAPGRVFLGVGTGEALNEQPVMTEPWPGVKERRGRLREAIELIRLLWTEERVDFDGEWFHTKRATIYDRPEQPVPIYVAAGGPLAAKLAGRVGDGLIVTSGKGAELYETLLAAAAEGAEAAGRDPAALGRLIEVKVSYDTDPEAAERNCEPWAALALSAEQKSGVDDPIEMERLADENKANASSRFIVSADPQEIVEGIAPYVEVGLTELVFHFPGEDQRRAIELFGRDVVPLLRERWPVTASPSAAAA